MANAFFVDASKLMEDAKASLGATEILDSLGLNIEKDQSINCVALLGVWSLKTFFFLSPEEDGLGLVSEFSEHLSVWTLFSWQNYQYFSLD